MDHSFLIYCTEKMLWVLDIYCENKQMYFSDVDIQKMVRHIVARGSQQNGKERVSRFPLIFSTFQQKLIGFESYQSFFATFGNDILSDSFLKEESNNVGMVDKPREYFRFKARR